MMSCSNQGILETSFKQPVKMNVVNTGCQVFKIFKPSRNDTAGTKAQALAHNKVFEKQCNSEKGSEE